MSIKQKICPHKPARQVKTAHGWFCLDCGFLNQKSTKNKQIVQKNLNTPSPAKKPDHPLILKHHQPATSTKTPAITIGMADIRPRKR